MDDILKKKDNIHHPVVIEHLDDKISATDIHRQLLDEDLGHGADNNNQLEEGVGEAENDDLDDPDDAIHGTISPATPGTSSSATGTTPTPHNRNPRKPTLVKEIAKLRDQHREIAERKLVKFDSCISETKRTNDLLEEHNNLLKRLLEKFQV